MHERPGSPATARSSRTDWNGRSLHADRHRRRRPRRPRRARAARSSEQARAALADADVAVLVVDARAGLRPGDQELADLLRRSAARARRGEQDRRRRATSRSPPSSTASASASRSRCRPRRVSGPATCSTASSSCAARRRRTTTRTTTRSGSPSSAARTSASPRSSTGSLGAERVIVSAGRGHDARRDRPAARARRARARRSSTPPGIRRQSKVGESIEYYTSLRSRAGRRARRRRARRLRRHRRRHRQDLRIAELAMQQRLRDRAGAQQVGHRARTSTSTTSAPGRTRSCACARAC